jgi:hypothetical protein
MSVNDTLQRNLANELILTLCDIAGFDPDYLPPELLNLKVSPESRDTFILLVHAVRERFTNWQMVVTPLEKQIAQIQADADARVENEITRLQWAALEESK